MAGLLFVGSPRTAGPQPRDVLQLALLIHRLASHGGAPAPRRAAARTALRGQDSTTPGPHPAGVARTDRSALRKHVTGPAFPGLLRVYPRRCWPPTLTARRK